MPYFSCVGESFTKYSYNPGQYVFFKSIPVVVRLTLIDKILLEASQTTLATYGVHCL